MSDVQTGPGCGRDPARQWSWHSVYARHSTLADSAQREGVRTPREASASAAMCAERPKGAGSRARLDAASDGQAPGDDGCPESTARSRDKPVKPSRIFSTRVLSSRARPGRTSSSSTAAVSPATADSGVGHTPVRSRASRVMPTNQSGHRDSATPSVLTSPASSSAWAARLTSMTSRSTAAATCSTGRPREQSWDYWSSLV